MRKFPFFLIGIVVLFACAGVAAAGTQSFTDPDKLIYPPLRFQPPQAKRLTLSNGMILYVLEDHELPLVDIHIVIKTGSYFDPEGKEGLAELTGAVLRAGGTETMAGSAVDEELESLAVDIDIATHTEYSTIAFSSLKNNLERGMEVLSGIMKQPVFAEDKLRLKKNLKTEELRRIADDPVEFAFREFNRLLYRGNPMGRLPSLGSVERVSREDIFQFYKTFYVPANMMIAATGDITEKEAAVLMEKYFGSWPSRGKRVEALPPAPPKGGIYYLAKGAPQSVIIRGHIAPAKKSSDLYAFTVLDFILGSGGFRSHIFQEIRTNRGLAYSAGSLYRPRSDYGVFVAYAVTKASSTGEVVSLLNAVLGKAINRPADLEELKWAKKSIDNSFIFSFSSAERIALLQMMLEFDKLPSDHILAYRNRVEKVSVEDLKRAAYKYLSPEEAVILIAGNESDFDQPLSAFGKVERIKLSNE
jgi:predicted Zn-dependent peptidase